MANFKAQITSLVGNNRYTVDDTEINQWCTNGAKEIINVLPPELKMKCMTATGVGTDFKVDLDGLGEILYVTRENADSGYLVPCRQIPPMFGGLATDSSDLMFYATVTDPVYWIDGDNSGAATLYVKPTPTANQPAIVHHIAYPTVVASDVSTIANFPDEAEYLVVMYAAMQVLCNKMNEMHHALPIHSDQDGSFTAPGTVDASSGSAQGWEVVRHWLETEEDSEMASSTAQALGAEIQQFVAEYQWLQGQHQMLNAQYKEGLGMIMRGGKLPEQPQPQPQRTQ